VPSEIYTLETRAAGTATAVFANFLFTVSPIPGCLRRRAGVPCLCASVPGGLRHLGGRSELRCLLKSPSPAAFPPMQFVIGQSFLSMLCA
jgi:hypothetical protein